MRLGSDSHARLARLGLSTMHDPRLGLASHMVSISKAFGSGNSCQTQANNKQREDNCAF